MFIFQSFHCILPPCQKSKLGGLYLGDLNTAENLKILKENGITAILTTADKTGLNFKNTHIKEHKVIPAYDSLDYNLSVDFENCFQFIEEKRKNHNILVHCFAGISRSATIVIAYLIKKNRWTFEESFKFVKDIRMIISPNSNFERQLRAYEKNILTIKN